MVGYPRNGCSCRWLTQRLGHHDESRRWLDRFRNYKPNADPNQFWEELEIRLLRGDAEAVVLYDPTFPADPFAR